MLLFAFIVWLAAGEPTMLARNTIESCNELRAQFTAEHKVTPCAPVYVIPPGGKVADGHT